MEAYPATRFLQSQSSSGSTFWWKMLASAIVFRAASATALLLRFSLSTSLTTEAVYSSTVLERAEAGDSKFAFKVGL